MESVPLEAISILRIAAGVTRVRVLEWETEGAAMPSPEDQQR
jgi:hypothetical protein